MPSAASYESRQESASGFRLTDKTSRRLIRDEPTPTLIHSFGNPHSWPDDVGAAEDQRLLNCSASTLSATHGIHSNMSKFSLQGRLALVTGGARGCGLAFAQGLAEAGADVAIFDVIEPSPAFAEIPAQFGVQAKAYTVDVTAPDALEAGFAQVKADFGGRFDILVACAGVNKNVTFLETSPADMDRLLGVNVRGVYFAAQQGARAMMASGTKCGSIVLVASIASYMAIRSQNSSAYCATKGAVRAMVAPIAAELQPHGIRVNSISPGYVRTEMTAPFPHLLESWKDEIMIRRVAEPDDIKGACVFLASDASKYCTGTDILVDGGVTKW